MDQKKSIPKLAGKNIVHIIGSLESGGAEHLLWRLAKNLREKSYDCHQVVISLTTTGTIGRAMIQDGITVYALGLSQFLGLPFVFLRLVRLLSQLKPAAVQTWLYHADAIGGIAARLAGVKKIFWGVHSTRLNIGVSLMTRILCRTCALLSYFIPTKIVVVAEAARIAHASLGYDKSRMVLINNGFTLPSISERQSARCNIRSQLWGAKPAMIIGSVSRFNPDKDPYTFVQAARIVVDRYPSAKFLMIGRGLNKDNVVLMEKITSLGLADHFQLMGEQEQRELLNYFLAMDIFCLHSATEAFPLVLGEAMAAALPCAITDVGDARTLLGEDEFTAPPRDPAALAETILRLASNSDHERHKIGERNRQRIAEKFGFDKMSDSYWSCYSE